MTAAYNDSLTVLKKLLGSIAEMSSLPNSALGPCLMQQRRELIDMMRRNTDDAIAYFIQQLAGMTLAMTHECLGGDKDVTADQIMEHIDMVLDKQILLATEEMMRGE